MVELAAEVVGARARSRGRSERPRAWRRGCKDLMGVRLPCCEDMGDAVLERRRSPREWDGERLRRVLEEDLDELLLPRCRGIVSPGTWGAELALCEICCLTS